jgi:hypothetical protein
MMFNITDPERVLLLELLESKHTAMLHELNHTDARDYRVYLRSRIELLEALKSKVEALPLGEAAV